MLKRVLAGVLSAFMLVSIAGCSTEESQESGSGTSGGGVQLATDPSAEVEGNSGDVTLKDGDLYAIISVKDFGDITVKLYPDAAPKAVDVFVNLANDGFYEGKNFHRVVQNFVIQGGMATNDSKYEEFDIEPNYSMRHYYGALCCANAMGKNTTQFYIVNSKSASELSVPTIENNISYYEALAASYEKGSYEYDYLMFQADYYRNVKTYYEKMTDEEWEKYKEVGGAPSLDGNYTVFGQTVDGFDVIDKISSVELQYSELMGSVCEPVEDVIISSVTIKTYGQD
ncbi:MAG: peptidylprolyl isomerase [Eubacterium sp.]|nr:peptidylprolyl isomerase [Eubacterium sp.]